MFRPQSLIESHRAYYPSGMQSKYRGSLHFEYLYQYAKSHQLPSDMVNSEIKIEQTALWITSYLAHWGMFRGSGKLRDTNLNFFKDMAFKLLNFQYGILKPFFNISFEKLHEVKKEEIEQVLNEMRDLLSNLGVSPTDTLISKIILGLTHNVPAYDRFFISGLRMLRDDGLYRGSLHLSGTGLIDLSYWYNQVTWPDITCDTNSKLKLPSALLIDMALNQYGRSKESNN